MTDHLMLLGCGRFLCPRPRSATSVRYTKTSLPLAHVTPAQLIRLRDPFDGGEYVYELKMDGFRALAYVDSRGHAAS
jgi:hypothetical protein